MGAMDDDRATRILLIRHGTTPTTGTVLPGRAPGLHLAEQGRAQARRVAERLRDVRLDAIYSSPLERAVETAAPTAQAQGIDPVVEPGLLECEFGEWTGRTLADLETLPEWRTVQREPSRFRFPGGESFVELRDRMRDTLERVRTRHEGGVVACVSHADPIRVCLSHLLGMPLDAMQRVSIATCSVSVVALRANADPVVLTVNSTAGDLRDLVAS